MYEIKIAYSAYNFLWLDEYSNESVEEDALYILHIAPF